VTHIPGAQPLEQKISHRWCHVRPSAQLRPGQAAPTSDPAGEIGTTPAHGGKPSCLPAGILLAGDSVPEPQEIEGYVRDGRVAGAATIAGK
jgi:hypothetical protein